MKFKNNIKYENTAGLTDKLIKQISKQKNEPKWMLELRLKAFEIFKKKPIPTWGPDLSTLDLDKIIYYNKPNTDIHTDDWQKVNPDIKKDFENLKLQDAEKKILGGFGAQYESEIIYHKLKEKWEQKGVIFENIDVAIHKYEKLIKKYFNKCVSIYDHKFSALHFAIWSGGTFIYIPKDIEVDDPLHSYFMINQANTGQFEHTLIVLEKNAKMHYIEGCSSKEYGKINLHVGCVEIFLKENAQLKYSSIENWSKDTYNLNTKRAILEKNAKIQWTGGNIGSKITMLYPMSILKGNNSSVDYFGISIATSNQNQDIGAKVIHIGKNTSSNIVSKSISKNGGITNFRSLIDVKNKAVNTHINIICDNIILDNISSSYSTPTINISNNDTSINYETKTGKIDSDILFYLQSRGISEKNAVNMVINGFTSPIVKKIPLDYAVELNRMIEEQL